MTEHQAKDPRGTISRPIKLHWGQQAVLGVAALGLIGTGWWAQIVDHHGGAGTVAFVVTGAAVGVVATVGRFPNRISGKDYTAEFDAEVAKVAQKKANEEVQRGADEFVGAIPPNALPVLQSAVDEYKGVTVGTTTVMEAVGHSIDEREQFDRECMRHLSSAITDGKLVGDLKQSLPHDIGLGNAIFEAPAGTIIFEFRARLSAAAVMQTIGKFQQWRKGRTTPSRLLILTSDMNKYATDILEIFEDDVAGHVSVVHLTVADSRDRVIDALTRAIDSMAAEARPGD